MINNDTKSYQPEELRKLEKLNISNEELKKYDVLILPENFESDDNEQIVDAQDAIQLSKWIKQEGIACANSYDLGLDETVTLERRSDDLWFGHIYILNDVVIPVVVSVLANLISPLIQHKKTKVDKRKPTGEVHVEMTIVKNGDIGHLKYNGDGETFVKMIESLKPNDKPAEK